MAMNLNFDTMSIGDALTYCYRSEKQFIAECDGSLTDNVKQFDRLVECIETGEIKPSELPQYGMIFDYVD